MLDTPGLYVHLPWCVRKCPYCDFNSHPVTSRSGQGADFDEYLQALLRDWQAQLEELVAQMQAPVFASVFFGGGTPSLAPPRLFATLLELLPLAPDAEITMEANPGTIEYHSLADYLQAGINRLSIGAQSFSNTHLQQLGRIHHARDTATAFARARAAGFSNINLDLMWGLPQQSVAEALADLEAAVQLQPEHVSWYQLTIEPKTEFARRVPLLPVEDTLEQIERHGLQLLEAAGFQRYEVSAFARTGRECRHNLNYWRFGDYVGLGAGAHGKYTLQAEGKLRIMRTEKAHQPRVYTRQPAVTRLTPVPRENLAAEFMLNALRIKEGVAQDLLAPRTGLAWRELQPLWQPLARRGLVRSDRCATTPLGYRYLNSVVSEFV